MSYIDTSVLAAFYCPEKLSKKAQQEIRKLKAPTISQLTDVELCSALSMKINTGDLAAEEAHRVLSCFRMHCAEGDYHIVPIGTREHTAAANWISAFATPLRTLDALHLAAAFANGLKLLTADTRLAAAAKHFGVKCKLLR